MFNQQCMEAWKKVAQQRASSSNIPRRWQKHLFQHSQKRLRARESRQPEEPFSLRRCHLCRASFFQPHKLTLPGSKFSQFWQQWTNLCMHTLWTVLCYPAQSLPVIITFKWFSWWNKLGKLFVFFLFVNSVNRFKSEKQICLCQQKIFIAFFERLKCSFWFLLEKFYFNKFKFEKIVVILIQISNFDQHNIPNLQGALCRLSFNSHVSSEENSITDGATGAFSTATLLSSLRLKAHISNSNSSSSSVSISTTSPTAGNENLLAKVSLFSCDFHK